MTFGVSLSSRYSGKVARKALPEPKVLLPTATNAYGVLGDMCILLQSTVEDFPPATVALPVPATVEPSAVVVLT